MVAFGINRRELKVFLERSLREKEKNLLLDCYTLKGNTFSSIVAKLSGKYAESTIKLVLRRLKKFNLIDFGNHECKGKPLNFTNLGRTFLEILRCDNK